MDSLWDFLTSWTFMAIMAGLLCLLVLLIPVGILLAILFVRRADRENRDRRD
jgi:glycopeptide antibiotics resistance protein